MWWGSLICEKCFDCLELDSGDASVEGWWVRTVGKANTADIQVGAEITQPRTKRQKEVS